MAEKAGYTAVPFEDSQVPSERELPPYSEKPRFAGPQTILIDSHECCYQHCQRRKKAWRKVLFAVLILFLGGKFLLAGLSFFMSNDFDHDQFAFPGLGPHNEPEIGLEMPYNAPPVPSPPEAPECEPKIKWNGPNEVLLDPRDVTGGLLFSVKGMSAHGSVIIRQDPHSQEGDFINITNIIRLSEDSLQKQVDIRIDIIDDDYSVVVETPSFDGPRPTQRCVQVDTIITIPNNTHYLRSLVVDVPNSWISAESLEAIDFAYLSLKSRSGHIRAEGISAGIAEIATVNGHIQGEYVVAESMDVRTVNGAIAIKAIVNHWSDEVSVITKSINGHLDISVDGLRKKQILNLKAGSVNGGVIANVPDTFHGDFSISTLVGYAYVEGKDITYIKKTRNAKAGHKSKKDEGDDGGDKRKKHCRHHHKGEPKDSQIVVEAVTGAVELYFL